ncbi:MAG: hypothetical protein KAG96_06775 [Ichthyobacteriaceae bacterium]|nr:hypothetical protein [Ichthyobacteriaceae bacterium]
MKKLLFLSILLLQLTNVSAQDFLKSCRFKISPYMAVSDYNENTSFLNSFSNERSPLTMSGIDVNYSFGFLPFSRVSGCNFEIGGGIYHFSEDMIMGSKGFKANLAYKYTRLLNGKTGLCGFLKGTGQLVYADASETIIVPRFSFGIKKGGLQLGIFGEYQSSDLQINTSEVDLVTTKTTSSAGVELTFGL